MWATRRSYEQRSNCTSVVVRPRSPNLRVNGFEFFLFYRGPAPNLFKTSPPFHPFQRRTNQQRIEPCYKFCCCLRWRVVWWWWSGKKKRVCKGELFWRFGVLGVARAVGFVGVGWGGRRERGTDPRLHLCFTSCHWLGCSYLWNPKSSG